MLTAIIGGVSYPITQYKLRELIAAGPFFDEIQDAVEGFQARDAAKAAALGLSPPEKSGPSTSVEQFAFMRATLGIILPGIQAGTVAQDQELDQSPITLDHLVAAMAEDEFGPLAALIPKLKERVGIASGEAQPASPPETTQEQTTEPAPSPIASGELSSSLQPADARADPPV